MGQIILPKRYHPGFSVAGSKPTGPVAIDYENPLASGLVSFILCPEGIDVARGVVATRNGTVSPGVIKRNAAGVFAAQNDYLQFAHAPALEAASVTIVGEVSTTSDTTVARIISKAGTDGENNPYRLTFAPANNGFYFVRAGSASLSYGAWQPDGALGASAGGSGVFGVATSGTTWTAPTFAWGGAISGATRLFSGSDVAVTGADQPLRIGQWDAETGPINIGFIAIWGRRLSSPELRSVTLDPYQLLKPAKQVVYFIPSAGGGGATLTADAGTYTLTGTAATLKADRKLAADSGSYAITGTDVSLKLGRKLTAESGSYALTGTDVSLIPGRKIVADSGTYTVNGTTVSLTVGRKLTADSGAYSLTGTDVTLTYQPAGGYTLALDSGSYTLTGTAATLKVSRKLTAESGSYSLTGSDATFKRGFSVSAGAGSYTLTGTNVAFARTYVLGAETGAYTLTGSDVGLTWSAAPVVETPTHGGPSIYGKAVFREKEFRREYDEQIRRIDEAKLAERLIREDEELIIIMAALAA